MSLQPPHRDCRGSTAGRGCRLRRSRWPVACAGSALAGEADPADRPVSARRRHRYRRAPRRAEARRRDAARRSSSTIAPAPAARSAPPRRRRPTPDGYTLLFVAGPFTTVAAASKNRRATIPIAPVRAGRADRGRPARVRRQRRRPGRYDARVHRARASAKPGTLNYGSAGHRQHQSSRARAPEAAHRHRHRARPVQGHRAGDAGSARPARSRR